MNNDAVKHPSHYCDGGIETIDFIRAKLTPAEFAGYCKGNVIKYLSRAGKKGDTLEDLRKALVYLGWAVDAMDARPADIDPAYLFDAVKVATVNAEGIKRDE